MQLRKTSAFALYIGSYLPLGLILLVQDIDIATVNAGFCKPSDWGAAACGDDMTTFDLTLIWRVPAAAGPFGGVSLSRRRRTSPMRAHPISLRWMMSWRTMIPPTTRPLGASSA